MSKQPFLLMPIAEWLNDPRLRSCSGSARGVWIEVVGLMHQAPIYGVLKFADDEKWKYQNGHEAATRRPPSGHQAATKRPPSGHQTAKISHACEAEIARQTGLNRRVVERGINELYKAGVLSLTSDSYLTYPPMIEIHERRAKWAIQKARQRAEDQGKFTGGHFADNGVDVHPPSSSSSKEEDSANSSIGRCPPQPPVFSFQNEKQKHSAQNRAGLQVGHETGNGQKSPHEKFKEVCFAGGLPAAELYDALMACGWVAEAEGKEAHEIFTACNGDWKKLRKNGSGA